jgi:hypothetical protein
MGEQVRLVRILRGLAGLTRGDPGKTRDENGGREQDAHHYSFA